MLKNVIEVFMDFKRIKLEDFKKIKHFLNNVGETSCESTFISLFVWADYYDNSYCIVDDILFMRSKDGDSYRYSIPFCNDKDLKKAVKILIENLYPEKPSFWGQEGARFDKFKELFSKEYVFLNEDDSSDYIYLTENLSTLSGKKYHSKRNHISNFSKQFDWQYQTINKNNLDKVKDCAEIWYQENLTYDADSLLAEKQGVNIILDNMEYLGAKGGCIIVDERVVAFAIGSPINDEVFDIHFEKALGNYQGAYAVINREFAKNELENYKYINREDDLGIEGLRKAKLSYKPVKLLKKYLCDPKRYTDKQLSECREIYNAAFGDSGEFDDILFDAFQNNIELLENGNGVATMLFKLPCSIIKNKISLDAFYIYAVATKSSEQRKGYAGKLLEKVYGEGSEVLFLKPVNASLIKFYEANGYKVVTASPFKNEKLYIEVSQAHKKLFELCDTPKTNYTLMYRYKKPLDLEDISFAETLE